MDPLNEGRAASGATGNLGVIVVTYNTAELTKRAVASAIRAGADAVVVIDNGSRDGTASALQGMEAPKLALISRPTNGGFGEAANEAARSLITSSFVFLNSDAQTGAEAISRLADELEALGRRAIVGPRLVGKDGNIQRSAGLLPGPSDLAMRALGLHAFARWTSGLPLIGSVVRRTRTARAYASAETATETIDTTMISGACFAIGREAFEELGGFDERFFMYFEDADLCRRAAAAGMPIRYVPSAVVTHIGGASSSEDYHFGPLHARSMRQYLGKWYGPRGSAFAVAVLWLRAVGMSLTLQRGAHRAWRAWWAAVRDEDPRR